ncbi:MAG: ABC transporter substrate-binding protein [Gordonia sp. (in: high G+C Gram-positive bacteria)]
MSKLGSLRRFRLAGALLATLVTLSLAACSSEQSDTSAPAASGSSSTAKYGDITVQLDWLKNWEFAGEFTADAKGYFTQAGFGKVTFLAGGIGGVSAATALSSGKAWIALGGVADIAKANQQGADLRIVANTYQKNPYTLVSAQSKPINNPHDLIGKTIAVAAPSSISWDAFLKANHIDASKVHVVPYGDAQNDLKLGKIDGYMGYGSGAVPLVASGFKAQDFFLADYGLSYGAESVVVTHKTLQEQPEKISAFLTAFAQGWKAAFDDSDAALDLVIDNYGKDQKYDKTNAKLEWAQQSKLILTDESRSGGIGIITPAAVSRNLDALALTGITTTADGLFDTSLIADVYAKNPDLTLVHK